MLLCFLTLVIFAIIDKMSGLIPGTCEAVPNFMMSYNLSLIMVLLSGGKQGS